MGAVPEAIAADTAEKLHAVAAADAEEENHQAVEDEAPSSVDDAADGIEDQDHAENGILEEEPVQRDNDENIAKAPILGGASPSEASSEWPEQGFTSCDPPGGVPAVVPTTKSVITHYLVKIPKRGDNLVDFRTTDAQVKDKIEKKNAIIAKLQQKRAEKQEVLDKLVEPRNYLRECRAELQEKIEESKPVAAELKKINDLPFSGMSNVCRSEEDLDAKLAGLEHDLQQLDRPLTLREEKQIIREIQALKATREQVVVNASFRASKQDARQGYQARLKSLNAEIEELTKKKNLAASKVRPLDDRCTALTKEIAILVTQRKALDEAIDEVFSERRSLSAQEYAKNTDFHQNRRDISSAKQLAYAKDTEALKDFCSAQVERVMDLWNKDDSFRSEYMKNNLRSTIRRLATPDGRSLGPNEKPYELPKDETPATAPAPVVEEEEPPKPTLEFKAEPSKAIAKTKQKSDAKEAGAKAKPVSDDNENVVEAEDEVEADRAAISELAKQLERREVEMQKAREAEARKKKQAEKKQAKAQARIEKELVRKEKEKEKKLRKKTSATDEAGDGADLPSEQEKENLEPAVASENGEKSSPEEKKPSSVSRRGRKPAKSQVNTAVKLQLRRKRSIQRQVLDHWQIIAAIGVALLVVLGATMVFVVRAA